jgi:hypothetical protein
MKKMPKKLALAKETVRRLDNSDLGRVAGGTTGQCGSGDIGCELIKIFQLLTTGC